MNSPLTSRTLSLFALLTLTFPSAAQSGGEVITHWQIEGAWSSAFLGYGLAEIGDVDGDGLAEVLIHSYQDQDAASLRDGSLHIRSGADGSLLYKLTDFDYLDSSMDGIGDVNGDGAADFVVGLPNENGHASRAGRVVVYSGIDGAILFEKLGNNVGNDLGAAVCGTGDWNSDGVPDFAFFDDASGATVKVFSGSDFSLIKKFNAPTGADQFGRSIALAGDVDMDGVSDLMIADPWAQGVGSNGDGRVFVYSGQSKTLLYELGAYHADSWLGLTMASAGDTDGDGADDLLVCNGSLSSSNRVLLFDGQSGSLRSIYGWSSNSDNFGAAIASAGDLNEDGYGDIAISVVTGSWFPSDQIRFYSGKDGDYLAEIRVASGSRFAESMVHLGDRDGNGYSEFLVGAPSYSDHLSFSGGVVVLERLPMIRINSDELSANHGGVVEVHFDFSDAAAGMEYRTLLSDHGIGPTLHGVWIPLALDQLGIDSYHGIYPGNSTSQLQGTLDSQGMASGSMTFAPGLPSWLVGYEVWIAGIAMTPGGLPEFSSAARKITVMP